MGSESNISENNFNSQSSNEINQSSPTPIHEIKLHYSLLERIFNLSHLKFTDHDLLLIQAIYEVFELFDCQTIFLYSVDEQTKNPVFRTLKNNALEVISEEQNIKFGKQNMIGLLHQNFVEKKPFFVNLHRESIDSARPNTIWNLNCFGVTYNKTPITLAFANKTENFDDSDLKQLSFFMQSIFNMMEGVLYQQEIVNAKEKAEISELRYYEIQKVGKIGWYEALIKEGTFIGSIETYHIFFDEYFDHPMSQEKVMAALHPEDREHFINTVKINVRNKSDEFDWEYRVITPRSGVKYVYSKAFLKFDEQGNLLRRFGIVQDITEIKKREREIKQHNDRLESLLKISQFKAASSQELLDLALNETIKLTNCELGYILIFDEQSQKFRIKSSSMINKQTGEEKEINREFDLPKSGYLAKTFETHKPYLDNDCRTITDNDTPFYIGEIIANLLVVPVIVDNKVVALTGLANKPDGFIEPDIKQLMLLMDNVWKIVENHNYHEQLIRAKEKAEESDKLKSAFLANMSHEIRTPMNGIIGFSELIVQPDISEERRSSYANIVIESGKQLLTIVDDILDISKIEVGQIDVQSEPVHVNDLMIEVFSFFNPKAKNNNIALFSYKELTDKQSVIFSDKQRLVQIINNLLSNAFKFTSQGEIAFGYTLKNGFLEFYVRDTGIGIPDHMKDIVFERFRQAQQKTARQHRGTGLGLSISKRLVELLGGEIRVETSENNGSTFFFTIPYLPVELPNQILENLSSVNDQVQKKYTLLLAEDEEINFLYISELFSNSLTKIIHARNGIEAVEYSKSNPEIDLVLMDIKMPHMDGLEATKRIKAFRPELPIIAQTAFAMEADRETALFAGCDDFIAKPILKEQFKQVLEKYIPVSVFV